MKKLILILTIIGCGLQLRAAAHLNSSMQTDTAKLSKQIKKLNLKLADLNSQLVETRTRIPVDSVKVESALTRSHEAQVKSKKRSEQAVGGDMDDVKLAEKQAKKASKETSAADDATKQLENDRKKVKDLQKQLMKAQQELDKIQQQPV
jgi:chromosome segregation ATPase